LASSSEAIVLKGDLPSAHPSKVPLQVFSGETTQALTIVSQTVTGNFLFKFFLAKGYGIGYVMLLPRVQDALGFILFG
jgi:hypothetical protein